MKKLAIIALLFVGLGTPLFAQKTIEKTFDLPRNNKVELDLRFANDINVTSWDKNEVAIKITYSINNGKLDDAFEFDASYSTSTR